MPTSFVSKEVDQDGNFRRQKTLNAVNMAGSLPMNQMARTLSPGLNTWRNSTIGQTLTIQVGRRSLP